MRSLSLRARFTIAASLFLIVSCTALTVVAHYSANRMIDAVMLEPSIVAEDTVAGGEPAALTEPASEAAPAGGQLLYDAFRRETTLATVLIVLVGSVGAYFAASYVQKPLRRLSEEVKSRDAGNFAQPLPVPRSADEIRDLTLSFNQLLAQLQRSFALQRQFSADAAHELRTPLAVLQTKVDVFALSPHLDDETRIFIVNLQAQIRRLTDLVEDLLLFSRDVPLESAEPVPLAPLLSDVADELAALADEKCIAVRVQETQAVVRGQDGLLERVFYNLLENAIKYSPAGTAIDVAVGTDGECTTVSFADEGCGVPEELREAIFEPFFRVDASRSHLTGGNGLGLALCKKILERHGASIRVLPHTPRGSIFQVSFPA